MKFKKVAILLLALVLSIAALVGCDQGSDPDTDPFDDSVIPPDEDNLPTDPSEDDDPPLTPPAEEEKPILNGDATFGSEYYEGEQLENVNNRFNYFYPDGNSFVLRSLGQDGIGITFSRTTEGTFSFNSDSGIYTLTYTDGSVAYGKSKGDLFIFCNQDGSEISTVNDRGGDGVTEVMIFPRLGNTDYGYRDLAKNRNGDAMQALYRAILTECERFYSSTEDVSGGEGLTFAEIPLDEYSLSIDEIISVWKIFGLENPAYYFFGNTVTVSDSTMLLLLDESFAKASERAKYQADIDAMISECRGLISPEMSNLVCIMTIHDFLIKRINYAYKEGTTIPEDATWAHSIIGASSMGSGVCECYAKTFQLLCRQFDIETLTVSGSAGGAHAWNLVKLDGEWYAVDATWNDTGDDSNLSYDCFGLSVYNINASHKSDTPTELGVSYLYDLPVISNSDIQLVTLYEEGVSLGLYSSIDEAFSLMTDADKRYTVELFTYGNTGPLLLMVPKIRHYVFSSETPDVKSIRFTGGHTELPNDAGFMFGQIYLASKGGFTVDTEVEFDHMDIIALDQQYFEGIYIDGASALFENSCQLQLAYVGKPENPSGEATVYVKDGVAIIYPDVNLDNLIALTEVDTWIQLRGDSRVACLKSNLVSCYGFLQKKSMEIGRLELDAERGSVEAVLCDVKIGDVVNAKSGTLICNLRCDSLDNVPKISFDRDSGCPIEIKLDPSISHLETDMDGNETGGGVKSFDLYELTEPFVFLSEQISKEEVKIYYIFRDGGGYEYERTSMYEKRSDGALALSQTLKRTADGFIINGDTLCAYIGDAESVTVPDGVKHIGNDAFFKRPNLRSIYFPDGLLTISNSCFSGSAIEKLNVPSSLTLFGINTFAIVRNENTEVKYRGAKLDWLRMLRSLPDDSYRFTPDCIECTDGNIFAVNLFGSSNRDEEVYSKEYFTFSKGGKDYIVCYRLDRKGEAYFLRYYAISEKSLSGQDMIDDYSGSATVNSGIFTFERFDITVYAKITDDGFVFTDAEGNEISTHPTDLLDKFII